MPRSGLKITEDMNQLPRLIADLAALKHADVTCGWHAESAKAQRREGDATNAEVAAAHEFGTDHIKRRPFLAPAIDKGKDKILEVQAQVFGKVIDGTMSAEDALAIVGETGVALIKSEIVNGPHEPLAEETIAAKGSTKPLIDTGQMLNSCSYQVDLTGGQHAAS